MGKRRHFPITEKANVEGESREKHIRYAVSSMQGWRKEMEDEHAVKMSLPGRLRRYSYAAVFDGHGGGQVSSFCAKQLHKEISKNLKNANDNEEQLIRQLIEDSFLQLDKHMNERRVIKDRGGSTACCTVLSPSCIYFANCGDSRGVLCRNGKVHFATKDHKPTLKRELKRIGKAGGFVQRGRVNGILAMSRAMGDFKLKSNRNLSQCSQAVIPRPDVTPVERNLEQDEFLVIACDGIWDVLTNSEVVTFVKDEMKKTQNLRVICNRLLDHCLKQGSTDNMSVILVTLPGCPSKNERRQAMKTKLAAMHQNIRAKLVASGGRHPQQGRVRRIGQDQRKTRVPSPFLLFFIDFLKENRLNKGNICQLAKYCGELWRNILSSSDKRKYFTRYRERKSRLLARLRREQLQARVPLPQPEIIAH